MFDPNTTILAGVAPGILQKWLTEAQHAYHHLVSGRREVKVGYLGREVTYAATDLDKLESWIGMLQRQLGVNRGRRALRPYF